MWEKTKQGLKAILDTAWSMRNPQYRNRILYYHSVHPTTSDSHTPDLFEKQLLWLKNNGYRSVLIRDIPLLMMKNTNEDDRPWVAITFDDGYRDNVQYALPLLVDLGFMATFFIVAGMVKKEKAADSSYGYNLYPNRPMMTAGDLRTLVGAGMEVASHTVTHRMATRLMSLSSQFLVSELKESKKILETIIGDKVLSFSYPNGQRGAFSPETRTLITAQGYLAACTTMWGTVENNTDIFELPRCESDSTDSLAKFVMGIRGQREYRAFVHKVFDRSKVWLE